VGYERGPADIGWVARLARTLTLLGGRHPHRCRPSRPVRAHRRRPRLGQPAHLQLHVQRTLSSRLDGSLPGPEGSIDKLLLTEADQLLSHVIMTVRGAGALTEEHADLDTYFWSRAQSIFGGTQQIRAPSSPSASSAYPAKRASPPSECCQSHPRALSSETGIETQF